MATQNTPPLTDQTVSEILAALQSIAAAVNRGTSLIADAADERPASQEQSTTIVDYLVLRELVGRQADGVRRTVGAIRFPRKTVVFDGEIPATATEVAVFTRRSVAPAEVTDILVDEGSMVELLKKHRGSRAGSGSGRVTGFVLDDVTDDQPIVRIELRDSESLAVALGPRLAPVT